MALLCRARALIACAPFERWRGTLGYSGKGAAAFHDHARRLAADVEWAAKRLPLATKCLPRAMALSWILRRKRIRHALVIAVRPTEQRQSLDAMHAWVEADGRKIIGDLPGPWVETARFGG